MIETKDLYKIKVKKDPFEVFAKKYIEKYSYTPTQVLKKFENNLDLLDEYSITITSPFTSDSLTPFLYGDVINRILKLNQDRIKGYINCLNVLYFINDKEKNLIEFFNHSNLNIFEDNQMYITSYGDNYDKNKIYISFNYTKHHQFPKYVVDNYEQILYFNIEDNIPYPMNGFISSLKKNKKYIKILCEDSIERNYILIEHDHSEMLYLSSGLDCGRNYIDIFDISTHQLLFSSGRHRVYLGEYYSYFDEHRYKHRLVNMQKCEPDFDMYAKTFLKYMVTNYIKKQYKENIPVISKCCELGNRYDCNFLTEIKYEKS
jgi:hypothetical protein